MIKKTFAIFLLLFHALIILAQDSISKKSLTLDERMLPYQKEPTTVDFTFKGAPLEHYSLTPIPNKKKVLIVAAGHTVIWAGSYIALNKAWYADYPKESFHFFNDWDEWNQMDKAGHAWTAYQLSRFSTEAWNWTGLSRRKSAWLGSASAFAYQSIIEIQDGFSSEWGFSWGDMTANVFGAAAFLTQELGWKDQRLSIKMTYWPYDYPSDLIDRRNQLFGSSGIERLLKDYNSQTYWVSANLKAFLPSTNLPKWLNVSFGYASELMLGGTENTWTDKNGMYHDRSDIPRIRRFFLSPDIDFTKIKTRNKFVRGLLFTLNMVKIPAPALELNSKGKFSLHAVYF